MPYEVAKREMYFEFDTISTLSKKNIILNWYFIKNFIQLLVICTIDKITMMGKIIGDKKPYQ